MLTGKYGSTTTWSGMHLSKCAALGGWSTSTRCGRYTASDYSRQAAWAIRYAPPLTAKGVHSGMPLGEMTKRASTTNLTRRTSSATPSGCRYRETFMVTKTNAPDIQRTAIEDDEGAHLLSADDLLENLANLVLGVALLLQQSRDASADAPAHPVPSSTNTRIWDLIRDAVADGSLGVVPKRTAHGFFAVPLCSRLDAEGHVTALVSLHVWLADGERSKQDLNAYSYQSTARSWVLAGRGTHHVHEATHVAYDTAGSGGGEENRRTGHETHRKPSFVENKSVIICGKEMRAEVYMRDMSYAVPANSYHRTEVDPEEIYATLFHLDGPDGAVGDARALGPTNSAECISEQTHRPGEYTAARFVNVVDTLRRFELLIQEGRQRAGEAEWEPAQRAIRDAIDVCSSPTSALVHELRYLAIAVAELGNISRRFGHYDRARTILEELLSAMRKPSLLCAEIYGELGVICRHLGKLDEAKDALEAQYMMAKELGWERGTCRAVGNLGMINYQLSQNTHDDGLLDAATRQLEERVELARRLKETTDGGKAPDWNKLTAWEGIGLARLSLCHTARGSFHEAIEAARTSLDCNYASGDPTVIAMSRLFYGRALLLERRRDEALAAFNPPGTCTPAMALCKEPSEEYRGYLGALVADVGVHLDVLDEQGYSALDYAVFSGDGETERLVIQGLQLRLPGSQVERHRTEAYLRKGYRELFQEALRPVLLESKDHNGLQRLRVAYADALAADESKGELFDRLKFVRYRDFEKFGRLPMSSEGRTQVFNPKKAEEGGEANYIVFFSYTWCWNKRLGIPSPDDEEHTQYRRMLGAIKAFLELRPSIDPNRLGIWLDYACVDQLSPAAGVNALPLNLMQCNAVISLFDERYYSRAWCSLEVLIVQTLRRAWRMHSWFVCDKEGTLSEAPHGFDIDMTGKDLTYEDERPKLEFLERQSKLLG
ncbi:uncharacterized protein TRAVEDRAFT_37165 [Trametes versicolor FP-101664 SS1]|uniref:uncharacterized protein n=1 Tax=Trametes versicolor (strain FP-101664) TaxID=717944 RepID=UPI0004621F30|nr:uncharacterized protein TRAVEDRAFT_37165 [Trametes versicolor FP-101664 SS1]EIW58108.1 hypothetical protein TRAVEDRAFT_37165 [Trametes versicolor FP-101664 SS1]